MSTTSASHEHWLNLINECRASGLTDRQWCMQNGISVSTFYYHVRALRKKACTLPESMETTAQKQEVVQIPFWETEAQAFDKTPEEDDDYGEDTFTIID